MFESSLDPSIEPSKEILPKIKHSSVARQRPRNNIMSGKRTSIQQRARKLKQVYGQDMMMLANSSKGFEGRTSRSFTRQTSKDDPEPSSPSSPKVFMPILKGVKKNSDPTSRLLDSSVHKEDYENSVGYILESSEQL